MDKSLRNTLRTTITQCRRLLETSVEQVLEGRYGIYASGKLDDASQMTHLSAEEREYRQQVRVHLEHIQAAGFKPADAVGQLVREVAFTHLNRLCAYKLMETRKLIREAVSRGMKSNGFLFYLADHDEDEQRYTGGQQDVAYRNFLLWLGSTLSAEIGALFSPYDPANRLFPPQKVLDQILTLINSDELRDIWTEDETIGWVYQYFTPKELRDQARKESAAPRNTYELAFRNQFYTPRYVVQFLVDNTLGRIWYEMMQGNTGLIEQCQYLVRCPDADMPYRARQDPRSLKILDPACGSGHFLLYCFDLLEQIYLEAWQDEQATAWQASGKTLREDYASLNDMRRAMPGMILRHNLHGIDIDLRATQIAALALWLRAQRTYQEQGMKADQRPPITRVNMVCAEPMPGDKALLREFTATLQPPVLGQLVHEMFDKMQLAGEAGSLLKIEAEIHDAIARAKQQWERGPQHEQQTLFPEMQQPRPEQLRFDVSGISDAEFWNIAGGRVLEALRDYASHATNGRTLQRRLFADDAERGFGFVDMCRRHFDVVLMNPPFGAASKLSKAYIGQGYPRTKNDVYAAFVERGLSFIRNNGYLGAITSRTGFFLGSFQEWREQILLQESQLICLADLGSEVLDDAAVEVASYVVKKGFPTDQPAYFFRLLIEDNKDERLLHEVSLHCASQTFVVRPSFFSNIITSPFVYWLSEELRGRFSKLPTFDPTLGDVRCGLSTNDNPRFVRTVWEISPQDYFFCYYPTREPRNFCRFDDPIVRAYFARREYGKRIWAPHVMAGASQPWFSPMTVVVNWENEGKQIKDYARYLGNSPSRNVRSESYYFRPGFSWTRRAVRMIPYVIPGNSIPTASRYMAFPHTGKENLALCSTASNVASAYLRMFGEKFEWPNFLVDNLKSLPLPENLEALSLDFGQVVREQVSARRNIYRGHEPFYEFTLPFGLTPEHNQQELAFNYNTLLGDELEKRVAEAYGFTAADLHILERDMLEAVSVRGRKQARNSSNDVDEENNDDMEEGSENQNQKDLILDYSLYAQWEANLSYFMGCAFGRWDVRFALEITLAPGLPEPFEPFPVCPLGMLISPDGLPATSGNIVSEEWLRARPSAITLPTEGAVQCPTIPDEQYPFFPIAWDGILVDDPDHEADIVRRVGQVLELIWGQRAGAIVQEACTALGVANLRDYFRRPGKGGFWDDHIKRYSKSRRKAPIYWLLQSAKKNYALWIYYHRLDSDILYKALLNYVEPKIRLEEHAMQQLASQREGREGRDLKELERRIEHQETCISELRDFHTRLRRVADLHLTPDLNDGVVLNIAPLWDVVPWKEAKTYWNDLLKGKYAWSSIGAQLREKGLIS